ncbi:urokinase plasminogen activator surface receptor-like isoform X2 [Sceloporus undulatus]|uniref:urokinase plasminogen activator surface receptor-like isoform X2 n=1 Tax=Sceloporus undulatus TaxID=8520 RepID=UPI001C4AFD09|nr:urokinase plasminogen activator surface receptor-like isoform X2 [Sceloporus undulatus]
MRAGVSLAVLLFCLDLGHNLRCQKCMSQDGNCTGATSMELCGPRQDSCFFEIKQFLDVSADTVKRGCGTANACRRYPEGYRGHLFRSIYCCSSDLCEPLSCHTSRAGPPNGLSCQSCIGSSAECGQEAPSEPCRGAENQCVQISQRFLPGEEQEPLIKGCGAEDFEDALLAYQVGRDFAYMDQKVCRLNNCNNRSFPDIPAGRPNGLQCYTCRELGRGDCAPERLLPLNCSGDMDWCLHVIGKGDGGAQVTLQKGCGTETMCGRHQEIYRKLKGPGSFASCCKGRLCNRARGLPVPVVGPFLAMVPSRGKRRCGGSSSASHWLPWGSLGPWASSSCSPSSWRQVRPSSAITAPVQQATSAAPQRKPAPPQSTAASPLPARSTQGPTKQKIQLTRKSAIQMTASAISSMGCWLAISACTGTPVAAVLTAATPEKSLRNLRRSRSPSQDAPQRMSATWEPSPSLRPARTWR